MRPLVLTVTFALSLAAAAHERDFVHRNSAKECSEHKMSFGEERTHVRKETLDGSRLRSLKASATNSPIDVEGGNAAGYAITICKAASALADLDRIHVTIVGDELKFDGPDHDRWAAMVHIHAPRAADLELSVRNGPIAVRNVEGKVVVRATNGPLDLTNIDGTLDAETTNGPISISGGSGTLKAEAKNGPLSIKLAGASFDGTLDASTKNGPLTLKLPRGYGSGVVVEAKGHGPISCRAEGCNDSWRSDDDGEPRRIELGRGPANVHLSTVNGPVLVKDE